MIEVKEAVELARKSFGELYQDRPFQDVTLEEVEASEDDQYWSVTLGFSEPETEREVVENPLAHVAGSVSALAKGLSFLQSRKLFRRYKTFRIDAETGRLRAMKDREL
jgi:hypothetical protein